MRIWFISDTHGKHERLVVPGDIDAVIHCGDAANSRDLAINANEMEDFLDWWKSIPIRSGRKIYVPGNHDVSVAAGMFPYLMPPLNESLCLGKYFVWCSPYTPRFGEGWAYMEKRNRMDMIWSMIPEDLDILITHGPPKGILDLTRDNDSGELVQVGCKALLNTVVRTMPRIHAFGHIHDEKGILNAGVFRRGNTTFVNCAVCDNRGRVINNGFVLDV